MDFAYKLRNYRIEKGLSAETLSEKANMSSFHIRQLENGKKKPTLNSLIAISDALGISPDCLMFANKPVTPDFLTSISTTNLESLTDEQIQFIAKIIEVAIHQINEDMLYDTN